MGRRPNSDTYVLKYVPLNLHPIDTYKDVPGEDLVCYYRGRGWHPAQATRKDFAAWDELNLIRRVSREEALAVLLETEPKSYYLDDF